MNLAFCQNISTISAKPKKKYHEEIAFNRTGAITERNLQNLPLISDAKNGGRSKLYS